MAKLVHSRFIEDPRCDLGKLSLRLNGGQRSDFGHAAADSGRCSAGRLNRPVIWAGYVRSVSSRLAANRDTAVSSVIAEIGRTRQASAEPVTPSCRCLHAGADQRASVVGEATTSAALFHVDGPREKNVVFQMNVLVQVPLELFEP